MKKLLKNIAVALGCTAIIGGCEAKDFAAMPNANGGIITLGDESCAGIKGWFSARSVSQDLKLEGCWTGYNGEVLVLWGVNGGMVPHEYPTNAFVKVKQE